MARRLDSSALAGCSHHGETGSDCHHCPRRGCRRAGTDLYSTLAGAGEHSPRFSFAAWPGHESWLWKDAHHQFRSSQNACRLGEEAVECEALGRGSQSPFPQGKSALPSTRASDEGIGRPAVSSAQRSSGCAAGARRRLRGETCQDQRRDSSDRCRSGGTLATGAADLCQQVQGK